MHRWSCRLQILGAIATIGIVACSNDVSDTDGGSGHDSSLPDGPQVDQGMPEPDQGIVGPGEFGRPCNKVSDPCTEPHVCVPVTFSDDGFCTKHCTNQGVPCNGAPAGTVAYCIIKDNEGNFSCAFICAHPQLGNQKCPTGLICPEKDNMAGGGKICVPPPR